LLSQDLSTYEIEHWLRESDPEKLQELWDTADSVRRENVGDDIYVRGMIEISNHCSRTCAYCGLRAPNAEIIRYRMTAEEIMECVHKAVSYKYGSVVLQSGEDYGIQTNWLSGIIKRVKSETGLAVTLSMGERPREDLAAWKEAGADRYLMRFETSDPELYDRVHPASRKPVWSHRFMILDALRGLGYEVGGGVMIGIPGQSFASLARDIEYFRKLDLDLVGVGPYVAHPETPLGSGEIAIEIDADNQVYGSEEMTCKTVALTRIVCPDTNIPSSSALAAVDKQMGRELGLRRGANILMPNLTPSQYRVHYDVYPEKSCVQETADAIQDCLQDRSDAMGRAIGSGAGKRQRKKA
jgi:biotin synthase